MTIWCKLHSREDRAHTHSQEKVECEVVSGDIMGNEVTVITPDGVKCHAIHNPWTGWMADDKYATVK